MSELAEKILLLTDHLLEINFKVDELFAKPDIPGFNMTIFRFKLFSPSVDKFAFPPNHIKSENAISLEVFPVVSEITFIQNIQKSFNSSKDSLSN